MNIVYTAVMVFFFFNFADMVTTTGHYGFSIFLKVLSWVFLIIMGLQVFDILSSVFKKVFKKKEEKEQFVYEFWKGGNH